MQQEPGNGGRKKGNGEQAGKPEPGFVLAKQPEAYLRNPFAIQAEHREDCAELYYYLVGIDGRRLYDFAAKPAAVTAKYGELHQVSDKDHVPGGRYGEVFGEAFNHGERCGFTHVDRSNRGDMCLGLRGGTAERPGKRNSHEGRAQ
jgi:hypothetical protein